MKTGYIQVYTGDGKGKTTAALGLAMRASGAGMRVYIGQFIKDFAYSEILTLKKLEPSICVEQYGKGCGFVYQAADKTAHIAAAREGLEKGLEALKSGRYDVVILDEINVAAQLGLLEDGAILNLMDQKPEGTELILTGRNASTEVMERADLVTEMKEIKHYYNDGVEARLGIER